MPLTQLPQPPAPIPRTIHFLHERCQSPLRSVPVPIPIPPVHLLLLLLLLALSKAMLLRRIGTGGAVREVVCEVAVGFDAAAFVAFVPALFRCLSRILVLEIAVVVAMPVGVV